MKKIIYMILGMILLSVASVMGATYQIMDTYQFTNFSDGYGAMNIMNASVYDNRIVSNNSYGAGAGKYYSPVLTRTDNSLYWDKVKWTSTEDGSSKNVSMQFSSNPGKIINITNPNVKDYLIVGFEMNEGSGNYSNDTRNNFKCYYVGAGNMSWTKTYLGNDAIYFGDKFSNDKNSSMFCTNAGNSFDSKTGQLSIITQFTYDNAVDSTGRTIVTNDNWDHKQGYGLNVFSDSIRLYIGNSTSYSYCNPTDYVYFSRGQVYTLLVTYDNSTKNAAFYVDGNNYGNCTITAGGTTLISASTPLRINDNMGETKAQGEGLQFNLAIYNKTLTPNDFGISPSSSNQQTYKERYSGNVPFVIMNHQLGNDGYLSETQLREQLQWLDDNGYNCISGVQFKNWLLNDSYELPKKPYVFRVDDGYNVTLEKFAPILSEYCNNGGVAAIITSTIESRMNWSGVQKLHDTYGWQICSHTVSHLSLTTLNNTRIETELNNSKNAIIGNTSGIEVDCLIPPFNQINQTVKSIAESYYKYVYAGPTQYGGVLRSSDKYLGIGTIDEDDNATTIKDFTGKVRGWLFNNAAGYNYYDMFYKYNQNGTKWQYTGILNDSSEKIQWRVKLTGGVILYNVTFTLKNPTTTLPNIKNYSNGIDVIKANYTDSPTKTLRLYCEGTGSVTVEQLNYIKGYYGTYDVYHNGVFVETASSNEYTTSSCSEWLFNTSTFRSSTAEAYIPNIEKNAISSLTIIMTLFTIIAIGLLIYIMIYFGQVFDFKILMFILIGIVVGFAMIMLGIYLLGVLPSALGW